MSGPSQLDIEESYFLKQARERVSYNPYGGTLNVTGFTVSVLYLIIRLLCVIIEQNKEIRRCLSRPSTSPSR